MRGRRNDGEQYRVECKPQPNDSSVSSCGVLHPGKSAVWLFGSVAGTVLEGFSLPSVKIMRKSMRLRLPSPFQDHCERVDACIPFVLGLDVQRKRQDLLFSFWRVCFEAA